MFKKVALILTTVLLAAGTAYGDTHGFKRLSIDDSPGGVVVLNSNPTVSNSPKVRVVMLSTEGEFTASFWRYTNGAYSPVGFQGSFGSNSDTLTVQTDLIWEGSVQADHIFIKGTAVGTAIDVDVHWTQ